MISRDFDLLQSLIAALTERMQALEKGVVVRPVNPTMPIHCTEKDVYGK